MRSLRSLVLTAGVIAIAAVLAATAYASTRHHHHGPGDHRRGHASLCGLDVVWLQTSMQGDVFEIKGGQLALSKSSNAAVRTLAQRLVTDHTQSLHEAQSLAHKYGIEVKTDPTPTQQWQLEELGELSGGAFDHDYAELEVLDHQQDIEEAMNEVKMGCNREIREDAAKEIPTLEQHLQLSKQALATTTED
jgi:putative membrane protein